METSKPYTQKVLQLHKVLFTNKESHMSFNVQQQAHTKRVNERANKAVYLVCNLKIVCFAVETNVMKLRIKVCFVHGIENSGDFNEFNNTYGFEKHFAKYLLFS